MIKMDKPKSKQFVLSDEDKQADEIKRVQKLIKKYEVNEETAQLNGIMGRARNRQFIKRSELKGKCPDSKDKKNIQSFIKTYNLAFPYPHEQSLKMAIEEGIKGTIRDPKKLRKAKYKSTPTLALHLPIPFTIGLKIGYPLIFSDKVQFEWFIKNFPEFNLKV